MNTLKPSFFLLIIITLVISACGGGGSSDDTGDVVDGGNVLRNIALSSEGGTVTTPGSNNASFIIDGNEGMATFWQADSNGDSVTIQFARANK
ncbi:MAG: hypothetical protein AAFZ92_05730 [Pseudomonadota bacterium]